MYSASNTVKQRFPSSYRNTSGKLSSSGTMNGHAEAPMAAAAKPTSTDIGINTIRKSPAAIVG